MSKDEVYDGIVSRHLNRRISRPMARLLAHTPATPNQVSFAAIAVALGSMACFIYGLNIPGALLAQFSSIIDGVDGDLARLKNLASEFGGFMDSILDRYADAILYTGLIIWAAQTTDSDLVWLVGFWALAGTFVVTYTRARIQGLPRNVFDRGIASIASRDVRLLVLMIGALSGQGFATIIALAALTNAVVLIRLVKAARLLR